VVQGVGDDGKQKARPAVADEDDALSNVARRAADRIDHITPLRFGDPGNAEQRRNHGGAPPPVKLVRNGQPARRSNKRTMHQDERRLVRR
jgi:hypothetical protein